MAKLKLDSDLLPEVSIFAISSHVNDYRLCWALNNSMGINMARRRYEPGFPNEDPGLRPTAFDHFDEVSQATISLLSNHSPQGLLVPEQRNADYFLLVDHACPWAPYEALDLVRRADFVLMAYPLEIVNLKDGYKLLQ
ncbi:MAG: IPExxxVDY family protein [Flavobacteriales bacterium]|nr:IPExxxVDY family protein [Flavobacteriales bacterium]MBP9079542.1 IPExxxVDY family protein [Flavobacteriales bacterium]